MSRVVACFATSGPCISRQYRWNSARDIFGFRRSTKTRRIICFLLAFYSREKNRSGWNRSGPLVVEQLAQTLPFFRRKLGEVYRPIAPYRHPFLHGRTRG